MDTCDRIFELLDGMGMEQQAFAAAVGVSDDTASDWRRRRSASYNKRLPQIAEVLETTTEYLLTGNGSKKKTAPAAVPNSDTIGKDAIMAAFFEGGEDLSEEEMAALWADAKDYIQYKLAQRRKKHDEK